ncbi:conserved exported hypothetical protein [Actinacidiphila cocklensis]|uniref:Secreted protein n=1 Tax=Actinacidiphila cocklensis TaxID=887465 RepID=A0A9W4GS71_9ACTN|nr:conserved exported hypothetical protein [Actinacidiphila cocklensis]
MRGNLACYAAAWCGTIAVVHRGLLHTCVWALTTAAAATLSWFGVHSVLRGTAYDPPRALPVTAPTVGSPTSRPSPPAPPPTTRATSSRSARPHVPASASTSPSTSGGGDVHGYTMRGGRVVLALGPAAATLVSAVPNSGWKMQVWPEDGWLRVTFTSASGGAASTVFCTWNGHPPSVQAYEE